MAVDPATLKAIAKVAVKVLTDEDTRKKVFAVALAPLIGAILIISMFFYILTMASGKLVVAIMSKGHFTSGGHFIVLRGVTSEGKILVADPASKNRSEQEWDLSLILNEARKDAAAGGPFWLIGASP